MSIVLEDLTKRYGGHPVVRGALARALAHQPEVLLLDEPFGALDAKVRLELRRTIREIQRELGITTLFVTHDQEEAFGLADRLAVLSFAGHTLPAERLLAHVWGSRGSGDRQLLKQLVHRLRQKIETDAAEPRYLVTMSGVGYALRAAGESAPS